MIYTIGNEKNYNALFSGPTAQDNPQKLGRTEDYSGGIVWQTVEQATANCPPGYKVYGVKADWDKDTAPANGSEEIGGQTMHDFRLLIHTSSLVELVAPIKTAGTDKDLMYVIHNMNSADVGKMLAMVAESPAALEMVLRRVHQLKDNNKISEGAFNAFSRKLHDIARAKGTIQQGQQIIAQPLSQKEEPENGV